MTALLKRPTIQAAIIQSALLLIFLYTPISQFRHAIYTPADYLQSFHLTYVAVQPDEPVKNPILSDVTQDVNSWLLFDRDTLRTGQIPLWNPYNGNGVPQLANYQSGIFSVYTLPFYVLPFKWALLLTAYLRLFVSGFFTFIFFKLLGLKQLPALFGSLAFMFCGYSIVWLSYPQSGTLTFLPLSLCCLEWAFQRYERRSPGSLNRALRWPLIGLTAALTIGLLGGHPETLYFCGLLVAAYTVFRLLTVWNADHFRRAALRSLSGLILSIGLAGLLALAISAVQILPFAEYLKNSFTVATYGSQRSQLHESARLWPLSIYPDLFGNPADPQSIGFFTLSNQIFDKGIFKSSFLNDIGNFSTDSNQFNVNAFINYNENIGAYPGAITLCLAIFGIVCAVRSPKRKTILFFGGVVLLSVIFA